MARQVSIGRYLLDQLYRHGAEHIFGVPGDYVLGFYKMIEESRLRHIGTTREDAAALAAEAYARLRGMGAVCVTYSVGGLNAVNAIAGAFAEKSPVVLVSGGPGVKERERDPLLHHRVGAWETQRRVFSNVTVAHALLDDPFTAYDEIDRVLHAVERYKQPGYIELPRDMVEVTAPHRHRDRSLEEMTDGAALAECVAEAAVMLNRSKQPVILAGEEIRRFGLQEALVELVEKTQFPVAATIQGKSVIAETHPLYLGVYEGAMGRDSVRQYVESADCLLMLGSLMTDMNLGIYTARLDPERTIFATAAKTSIRRHSFEEVPFRSFFQALLSADLRRRKKPALPAWEPLAAPGAEGDRITVRSLFALVNEFLAQDMVVIADVGDCLFGAVDLRMCAGSEFLSSAWYTSMGYAVPAAIGAQVADPARRPLVLVGDGAFQMTGMELSTARRLGLNPIVVVLNNHGYSTERQILEGPFNDIQNWRFSKVPELLGGGLGRTASTVGEFRSALQASLANTDSFSLIEVDLEASDISPALERLGASLARLSRPAAGGTA